MKNTPLQYALISFAMAPVLAALSLLTGLLFLVSWPFIPFLVYWEQKKELSEEEGR